MEDNKDNVAANLMAFGGMSLAVCIGFAILTDCLTPKEERVVQDVLRLVGDFAVQECSGTTDKAECQRRVARRLTRAAASSSASASAEPAPSAAPSASGSAQ